MHPAWWLSAAACLLWLGCDRAETPSPDAAASQPAESAVDQGPSPADARDDPQAPRALPGSHDVADWVKTEPIRLAGRQQLDTLISDRALLQTVRAYRVDRCAACTYTAPPLQAETLFLELPDAEESFGLFSVLTRQPGLRPRPADGMMIERRPSSDHATLIGWQGRTCLILRATGSTGEDHDRSVDQLARRILFSVPSSDPPILLRALPPARLADGKVWMVHRTAALKAADLPPLTRLASAGLDDLLGLTGRERLWIAALGQPPEESAATAPVASMPASPATDHLIWIVHYADASAARRAFDRYRQKVSSGRTELDRSTTLVDPVGPYLIGSWTAQAEAADPILPTLHSLLPTATQLPELSRPAASAKTQPDH